MVMVDHRSMHRLVLDRLMFPPLDRRAAQNQIHRARNGRIKKKSNNLYYMIIKQNSRVNLMVKCEKNSNIKTEGGCRSQQLIFNAQFDHNELQIGQNVNSKTNAHL